MGAETDDRMTNETANSVLRDTTHDLTRQHLYKPKRSYQTINNMGHTTNS